eukprot:7463835-Alexandrium_andersonii.AAC.1
MAASVLHSRHLKRARGAGREIHRRIQSRVQRTQSIRPAARQHDPGRALTIVSEIDPPPANRRR